MNKNSKTAAIVIVCAALVLSLGYTYFTRYYGKKADFEKLQATVMSYETTSPDRVNKAVITLPDSTTLVGLVKGYATLQTGTNSAPVMVMVLTDEEQPLFIPGKEGGAQPRLDIAAPMLISGDSKGMSTYVTLFNDRGDAAIEKSYVYLGGSDISVNTMKMLPPESSIPDEEYRLDVNYAQQGQDSITHQIVSNTKEVIVPVVDGHFDPKGTVAK